MKKNILDTWDMHFYELLNAIRGRDIVLDQENIHFTEVDIGIKSGY